MTSKFSTQKRFQKVSPACKTALGLIKCKSAESSDILISKKNKETKLIIKNTASGFETIKKCFLNITYNTIIETQKFFKTAIKDGRRFKVRATQSLGGHLVIREISTL